MKKISFASILFFACLAVSQNIQERLRVDATDAPRNILHSTVTVPVSAGAATLVYPKWIPGNHRPTGPIHNLTGLHIKGGGKELDWQRDLVDMYAFHLQVPSGVSELEVSFDTITYNGKSSAASSRVLDLNWNQVVVYPQGLATDAVQVTASIRLPQGWKFGTALTPSQNSGNAADFEPVSLTRLVDSPLIAGAIYRQVQLSKQGETLNVMDMVGESEASLQMPDKDLASYKRLVAEAERLFGAHHFEKYHFLVTLSDETAHHGLEHHESSDNGTAEDTFSDHNWHNLEADLLPHEFVHSWNGKYRRPAGLATPNYQEPMRGDLLWVYEGLTEYLGDVLAGRSGLWTPEQYREALAETAAMLDHLAGREWRPLEDTARSVQLLRLVGRSWQAWRRGLDYYPEGELIWLEVDSTIRQQTHGQKSLDDFCRLFYGPPSGPPKVVRYTSEDLVQALNQVAPYDWAKLFNERVNEVQPHAPLGGIERGGWRWVYQDKPNIYIRAAEKTRKFENYYYSLGFVVEEKGELRDV